jgi:saccharopine dehydrogenase-like NADP-dependent oxidoreductase
MAQRVLILGGTGCIGRSVATDLLHFTDAEITLTGRRSIAPDWLLPRQCYRPLRLATLPSQVSDLATLSSAIIEHDLVIHCAGPFRQRDLAVLETCIQYGKPYLDVADSLDYARAAIAYHDAAQTAGSTCVISTGIFPGISNSLVRQGIEQFDQAEAIHLSYLVAGSGGAGLTVLRTTFIELQTPFQAKVDGRWQTILPYSDREILDFPAPYDAGAGVYWFNTVEAWSLARSFPDVPTIITKFGSLPDFYNHLTGLMTKLPAGWLHNPQLIEGLSRIGYGMTRLSDCWSGIGIAIRLVITGIQEAKPAAYRATLTHANTAQAAGYGTGSLAALILSGQLRQPGVWPVEQALSTPQFEQSLKQRNLMVLSD